MSRKHRKHNKSFPWVMAAFGGILIIAAIALFASQNGGGGSGAPAIAVDQPKIDYGYVKFGENKTFAIQVANTGAGTLRFTEKPYIEVLEGC